MRKIEILLVSVLVAYTQGTNSSHFPNWKSSWIMGGSDAAPGEFPYMVSVRTPRDKELSYCGGSIINNRHILTAAHCVLGGTASSIKVVAGTNKLNSGGHVYGVSNIIMHHAYDITRKNNDIALLRLIKPIVYSSTVQPVALPNSDEGTTPGMGCVIMGWGCISNTPLSFANNLQKLQLHILSNIKCERYYRHVSDGKMYATADSGKAACQGDSGGPFICDGKQVGIQRGGGRRGTICTAPYPLELVYVPKYIDWIKQHAH